MIQLLDGTASAKSVARKAGRVAFDESVYHAPVLLREVVELLVPAPGKLFVDGTLGGGGHSEAFLEAGARVIGLDQDPQALAFAHKRLAGAGKNFQTAQTNFADVTSALQE